MTTANTLQAAAVEALAGLLPAAVALEAALWPALPGEVPAAELTTLGVDYLGDPSAELALALPPASADALRQAGGPGTVSVADVVRPALEAAAESLGSGVLGEVVETGSTTLFSDPGTQVYRLSEPGSAEPFAWFAIKVTTAAPRPRGGSDAAAGRLGRIHDVEMALSVVIGKTRMTVANLLSLEPGDVVDLDRPAGAPADIMLNGRLIAHGEVVVVDQEYGVRVTKILDAAETVG